MRRLLLLLPLTTAACIATEADPPSLGPRAIEGILDEPSYAIAPVESASDPALAARIAELVAQAEAGDARFQEMSLATERAVDRAEGSAVESEAWIVAQLELSALDATRSPTTNAMGALDEILAEQAITGEPAESDALAAARARVGALYEAQAHHYAVLEASLRSR